MEAGLFLYVSSQHGQTYRFGKLAARATTLGAMLLMAANAHATDLVHSLQSARLQDSTLASAEATYRAAVETLPQAKAALGPSVQGNAGANQVVSKATDAAAESGSLFSGSVGVTQPLYRPAARLTVRQAEARLPGFEADLRKAQQSLILRVAQAYFSVLQALDTLDAAVSQKEALEAQRRQANRGMQIGTGTVIEQAEANSRFDLIVATELQSQGAYRLARRALEQLTGETTTELARLAPLDMARLADTDEEHWLAIAEENSLDVRRAVAQRAAQGYEIDLAKAAWKPTVDLTGTVQQSYSTQRNLDLSRTDGRSAAVGVSVTIPIWEPGFRDSKLRQAVALVDQSDQDLITARRETAFAVRQAMTTLVTNAAQAQALEQAVQSSQLSLQASIRGTEIGARTTLDVLNGRQLAFATRTQLAGTRYAAVLALLQLKAAAGVLAEADLVILTDRQSVQLPTSFNQPASISAPSGILR